MFRPGLGFEKDPPDSGDVWIGDTAIGKLVSRKLPGVVDLRKYFPPVRDQLGRHTSTVFACLAVIEYFETRLTDAVCERSKLFLYERAQERTGQSDCRGLSIRETIETLKLVGTPSECCYPYSESTSPTSVDQRHVLGYSNDFCDLRYARLDLPDSHGADTLALLKKSLASDIPIAFGFEVHHELAATGDFPRRGPFYAPGWQAVVACGYNEYESAVLIRNSWGRRWGNSGYGWMPYEYIERDHAVDFWVMYQTEWIQALGVQS